MSISDFFLNDTLQYTDKETNVQWTACCELGWDQRLEK